MDKYYDTNEKLNIKVSDESDLELFNKLIDLIVNDLGAKIVKKLDGLDQKYWDFELNEAQFCLHLEHYSGITLYSNNKQANGYLKPFTTNCKI